MFTIFNNKFTKVLPVMLLFLLVILFGCSTAESDIGVLDDDENITFMVDDDNEGFSRGAYQTALQFSQYAIYSFNCATTRLYVANIVQTRQADGSWKGSRAVSFPGKNALDFYALKPGFIRDDVQELTMTPDEKSFVHIGFDGDGVVWLYG